MGDSAMEKTIEIQLAEHGERIAQKLMDENIWGAWRQTGYRNRDCYFIDQDMAVKIARTTK